MITSAEEFVALRGSDVMAEQHRATHDEVPELVWLDVIARYPDMKRWVVHNKTVPLAILELLSNDSDPDVRQAVAQKRKAGPEILARLAADPNEGVRDNVAWNAKTPRALLERLIDDPSEMVAQTAWKRLRMRFGVEPPTSG